MEQNPALDKLFLFLEKQKIVLNKRQKKQVALYVRLLSVWGRKINLVSKGDLKHIIEKHILSSFYYAFQLKKVKKIDEKKILDLGSGAGLPGVVLSICFPLNTIWLVDSSRKKTLFLKKVVRELGLNSVPVCQRIEKLHLDAEQLFNIVVTRAVAALPKLDLWVKKIVQPEGLLYTMKGVNDNSEYMEQEELKNRVRILPIDGYWQERSNYLFGKTMIAVEY